MFKPCNDNNSLPMLFGYPKVFFNRAVLVGLFTVLAIGTVNDDPYLAGVMAMVAVFTLMDIIKKWRFKDLLLFDAVMDSEKDEVSKATYE